MLDKDLLKLKKKKERRRQLRERQRIRRERRRKLYLQTMQMLKRMLAKKAKKEQKIFAKTQIKSLTK